MATDRSTVVAVFQDRAFAERAISEFKNAGFSDDQIQSEFESNRAILTVQAGDKENEALEILRRNGALDANSRFGQPANPDFVADTRMEGDNFQGAEPATPGATDSFFERPEPPHTPAIPGTPIPREALDDPGIADDPYKLQP
jgi:hypothetical protein